jgi:hypothetical protein
VTAAIAAGPSGALPTRLLCALGCGLAVKAGALRGAFCGSSRGANNRVLAYRMLTGLSNDADSDKFTWNTSLLVMCPLTAN